MYSYIQGGAAPVQLEAHSMEVRLGETSVCAGFPYPAEEFSTATLDISALLVEHPQATFLLRVAGLSMVEYGIFDGDLIVVDRALRPKHGHIVVAVVDGEFTVKKLHSLSGTVRLKAGNPTYPDITPKEGQILEVWGVVKSCIKLFN